MKFCPRCGHLVIPKEKDNKIIVDCSKCDFYQESTLDEHKLSDKTKPTQKLEIAEDKNLLAVYDHECKKCGYNKAQLIEISATRTDEDDIIIWKCGKCGAVEREQVKER